MKTKIYRFVVCGKEKKNEKKNEKKSVFEESLLEFVHYPKTRKSVQTRDEPVKEMGIGGRRWAGIMGENADIFYI